VKDTFLILKKEFQNIFKDRRTLFSVFVLPVVLFIVIFTVIGRMTSAEEQKLQTTQYKIFTDQPLLLDAVLEDAGFDFMFVDQPPDSFETALQNREIDGVVLFGELPSNDPSEAFSSFLEKDSPSISVYIYSGSSLSERLGSMLWNALRDDRDQHLRNQLAQAGMDQTILERPLVQTINVATEKEQASGILGGMLPYMLVIYLFSASFAIGFDTTAGEKERQTLTILLSNQVSRTSIAWGKILYIMSMNLISATVSVIAFSIGFSRMIPQSTNIFVAFSPQLVLFLFLCTLSMSVLVAAIIAVVGVFSKTMKEATSYSMPLYIVVLIFGIASLQPEAFQDATGLFFVPLINGIITLKKLFTTPGLPVLGISMTILINLTVSFLLVMLAARMFSDERFVFRTEN